MNTEVKKMNIVETSLQILSSGSVNFFSSSSEDSWLNSSGSKDVSFNFNTMIPTNEASAKDPKHIGNPSVILCEKLNFLEYNNERGRARTAPNSETK